jgi:hypothetical protein
MIDGIHVTKRHSYGPARYQVNGSVSVRFDYEASSTVESGETVVVCILLQERRITTQ